jgi:NADH:ubiquinone oxidoreductase subunit F (NADH-binding)
VVVNGIEAEPVSGKDKLLLRHLPHLVLDGAVAVAQALGARETIVVMDEGAASERAILERALEIRRRRHLDGKIEVRLATSPGGFVAGEETAVVNLLNGREAKPTFKPPLPFQRGVSGSPTLVQNVETLAHIALIARHGSDWFREVGTAEQPGTALLTVTGAVGRPGVYEVAFGTPLVSLLFDAGGVREEPQAFLVGGYFGTWVPATSARSLDLSETSLQERGAALGAGALAVLPASACGLVETARVTRYLATESAGQCGPCVHGLDAIARALESLALPTGAPTSRLEGWLEQVRGRGACRHPDGTVRFVASALEAFAGELEHHVRGRCSGHGRAVLPLDKRSR